MAATGPDELAAGFGRFAASYPDLPLYRSISEGLADAPEVASLLGAARPGQARPVLLLAALHDLVLRSPEVPAARWFARASAGEALGGDPWPDVRHTLLDHADELRAVVGSRATQTNEVNRAVHLGVLLAAACADVASSPVALVELGSSAGLLLGLDRFRIELVDDGAGGDGDDPAVLGDPASPVGCRGRLRPGSTVPPPLLPRVVERVGLDLAPVPLDDEREVRWLEACLWPDQPARLRRFRAAVDLLRGDPPVVVGGDMVDDLAATAHSARAVAAASLAGVGPSSSDSSSDGPVHLVVMCSWALTYVARDRRPTVAEALAELASDGRPVSWITAEPPGAVPGLPDDERDAVAGRETTLGCRRWRDGVELPAVVWGDSHPHGTSLLWIGP